MPKHRSGGQRSQGNRTQGNRTQGNQAQGNQVQGQGQGNRTQGNRSGNSTVQSVLSQIGVGTSNIRIHFNGATHEGIFLGFSNGSVVMNDGGTIVFIKISAITAVDIIP